MRSVGSACLRILSGWVFLKQAENKQAKNNHSFENDLKVGKVFKRAKI